MSRGNRLSARQLTELLTYMFGHRYAREYVLTCLSRGNRSS